MVINPSKIHGMRLCSGHVYVERETTWRLHEIYIYPSLWHESYRRRFEIWFNTV